MNILGFFLGNYVFGLCLELVLFMVGCFGGRNVELEIYKKVIVRELFVLFVFKICIGIWVGKVIYLFFFFRFIESFVFVLVQCLIFRRIRGLGSE